MAEAESWWLSEYPRFSLAKLSDLPAYQRLRQLEAPFAHSTDTLTESYTQDSQVENYFTTDSSAHTSLHLVHVLGTENWTFERSYREEGCEAKAVSRIGKEGESGEVEKRYFDHKTVETWEKGETIKYQKRVEMGETVLMVNTGKEREGEQYGWTEVSFTSPTMHESERIHTTPTFQSGEITHIHEPYSWGSSWRKSPFFEEAKSWRKAGPKTWSQTQGTACEKAWNDRLELGPDLRREDRLLQDGPRYRGFMLHRAGEDYIKLQWEGDKPDTPYRGIGPGVETSPDLRKAIDREKENVLLSLSTLKLMRSTDPEEDFPELKPLEETIRSEVEGEEQTVEKLLRLQDLITQLERQKRRIEENRKVTVGKYEAVERPLRELAEGAIVTLAKAPYANDPEYEKTVTDFDTEAKNIRENPSIPLIRIKAWVELLQRICKFSHSRASAMPTKELNEGVLEEIWATETAAVETMLAKEPETGEFEQQDTDGKLGMILEKEHLLLRLLQRLQPHEKASNPFQIREFPPGSEHTSLSPVHQADSTPEQIADLELNPVLSSLLMRLNGRLKDIALRLLQVVSISHPGNLEPIEQLEATLKQSESQSLLQSLWNRAISVDEVSDILGRHWDAIYRVFLLLDKLLSKTLRETKVVLGELNLPEEIRVETGILADKTARKDGEEVLVLKAKQLHKNVLGIKAGERGLADVVEELTLNNDELDQLLRQKSEEIVFLAKEMDKKDRRLRERQDELLTLRKFKAVQVDNSDALKDALIQLRESELLSKPEVHEDTCSLDNEKQKKHSLHYILSLLRKRREVNQTSVFAEWRGRVQPEALGEADLESLGDVGNTMWPPVLEAEYLTEVDAKELEKADLPLAKERTRIVKSNEIARAVQHIKLLFQFPLADHEFYRLIESFFRDKVQKDGELLFASTRPPSFPVFLIHHSISTMGSKDKGLQHVAQIALTLGKLYRESQQYAIFIARVMRLCDPHPATLEGELLALHYWQRLSYTRELPNDSISQGGQLPLSQILDTYYADFLPDPTVSHIWLSRIRPSSLSDDMYGLHLLAWRLRNMNKQPEEAFGIIASPFQRSDFAGVIRDQLELHLPKAVFGALWSLLRGRGALTVPRLKEELPTTESEDMVTVASFLNGVLDAHETKRKRNARNVLRQLTTPLSKETFPAFYRTLDPQASEEWVADLMELMREEAPSEPFEKDNVVQVLASHPPKPLQTPVLHIELLHTNLHSYTFSTSLDTLLLDTPVQRVRLIRTTETVLTTTRRLFKARRKS